MPRKPRVPKKPRELKKKLRPDGTPEAGTEVSPEWIKEYFKGKQGGEESETTLSDAKGDNFVTVYADNSTAVKIAQRCGSAFITATWWPHEGSGGVIIEIDKAAFRGLEYAFKRLDNKGTWTGPTGKSQEAEDELDAPEADDDQPSGPDPTGLFSHLFPRPR